MSMQVFRQDMDSQLSFTLRQSSLMKSSREHEELAKLLSYLHTLMEDQVAFLKSLGLSAIALHEEQSEEGLKEVEKGNFTYLFASTEKMLSVNRWCKLLSSDEYRRSLVSITIDEAHCISQWGLFKSSNRTAVPFRTWYGNLGEMNSLTSDVPMMVLTATAFTTTRREIFDP